MIRRFFIYNILNFYFAQKQKTVVVVTTTAYFLNGAGDGTRTRDLLITSQLLYQLSYTSIFNIFNLNGDPEGARTLDLQRDRLAF